MKIDTHQHFWKYHPVKDGWIPDEMSQIRKDFLPKDLNPLLESNDITGCVAVQAAASVDETNFLLKLASRNALILGVVGWVDFTDPDLRVQLKHFSNYPKFKGVRHLLQAYPAEYMLQANFIKGMSIFQEFNLSYDLLVSQDQLPQTIELVKRFPDQKFVLDHMAKPEISNGVSKNWKQLINELAENENVFCKLSGFLTETASFIWEPESFFPFFEVCLQAFGEDRLMYGSDWPVCLAAGKYEDTLENTKRFFSNNEGVLHKVMGHNAVQFYQL